MLNANEQLSYTAEFLKHSAVRIDCGFALECHLNHTQLVLVLLRNFWLQSWPIKQTTVVYAI